MNQKIAKLIKDERPIFYTEIADKLKITPEFVQLVQYLLCGADLAEYGTSPRGCWLTNKGEAWISSLKPYYSFLNEK